MSRLSLIYTATALHQAHLLHSLLEENGIKAVVIDSDRAGGSEFAYQSAQVYVNSEDAEISRGIAHIFDRNVVQHRSTKSKLDGEPYDFVDTEPENWQEWPTCPICKRRRKTQCPSCRDVGSDFPIGDLPDQVVEALPRNVVLICTTCDVAFDPEFYDRCVDCDHEFGNGMATPLKDPPRPIPWMKLIGVGLLCCFFAGLYLLALSR